MKDYSVKYWIEKLNLEPHPEGGYYQETLRSEKICIPNELGDRSLYTSIYYLLSEKDFSAFHRLNSDEIWYYHYGDGDLEVITIVDEKVIKAELLGIGDGAKPFILIPGGHWFAARLRNVNSYTLTSCVVSPGFEFKDFEIADKEKLLTDYPEHDEIINSLTR